jgi:two-component system C4-dicarboxylate transport response regulator DctD
MAEALKVLFVEDDPAVRFGAVQALQLAGIEVEEFDSAEVACRRLHPYFPGVLITDVQMRGMSGLELLTHAVEVDAKLPVILITGHGDVAMAVQAMRAGAYDFIEKPFSSDYLVGVVERALEKRRLTFEVEELRAKLEDRQGIESILIGQSRPIEELRRTIIKLGTPCPDVLIQGETGTGKELAAYCLHHYSRRRDGPFVALNCGAIPESLFESETFGHEAGAFTGAQKRRIGQIERAAGGTLFLDEVESLPLAMQVKLLRAVQERQVQRLGSNEAIDVDVRIVAATKVDLAELYEQGRFRRDLYYRLNVMTLEIPLLSERREDIPLLFEHFVLQAATRYHCEAPVASAQLTRDLMMHSWPGNVRELRNVADRFVLGVLGRPFQVHDGEEVPDKGFAEQVQEFERSLIIDQLRRQHGNVAEASERLGMPKKTLYHKIQQYGIKAEWYR